MTKRIFVSHNFTDRRVNEQVMTMLSDIESAHAVQFVTVEEDVSYRSHTAIDFEVSQLMQDCHAVLFVLADNPRNSPWLEREAHHALNQGLPITLTELPDVETLVPLSLSNTSTNRSSWNLNELSSLLAH